MCLSYGVWQKTVGLDTSQADDDVSHTPCWGEREDGRERKRVRERERNKEKECVGGCA